MNRYKNVLQQSKEIKTLSSILDLLSWDQETMMPCAANNHRTEQKALLSAIIHTKKTDDRYFDDITALQKSLPNGDESIIVTRLHHDIEKERKLPASFVETLTRATSEGYCAWQSAKHASDWKLFEPHLERIIELMREKSGYYGYKEHPYDALLDQFEPDTLTHEIDTLFRSLKGKLRALFSVIKTTPFFVTQRKIISSSLAEQLQVAKDLSTCIGFDWSAGRMDTSEHPFSTAFHPTDSRFTVRNASTDLIDQVMSALHETGHSLYEMGLPQQFYGTPLCEAVSLSIHESQSRFWETVIGRSTMFVPHIFQAIQRVIGKDRTPFATEKDLYIDINHVASSLIRTQADEVTYPFHVMVRFEIEKELLEGTLQVRDVPARWNASMHELIGITPENDTVGCLQDVHWSLGYIGYFPTYTLGTFYASCLYVAMKRDLPDLSTLIREGHFAQIRDWLSKHVWSLGRRYSSRELVTRALGRAPSEDDYLSYLKSKYTGLE